MAGISALSRSLFEDTNTRKFDKSDSRRLGQRRKILRTAVGHDTEETLRRGRGEESFYQTIQQPYGIRKETKPTTGSPR